MMKRVILLLAAFAIISCSKETEIIRPSSGSYEVSVSADRTEDTKTTLSGTKLTWSSGDRIGIYASGYQSNKNFLYSSGSIFKGIFDRTGETAKSVKYYSYYPFSEKASGTVISSSLSSNQTAPFDGKSDAMVADVLTAEYKESGSLPLEFQFRNHLFAIVKITVKNTNPAYSSESITKITLQTPDNFLAGAYTVDVSNGYSAIPTFASYGQTYVSMVYPDGSRPTMGLNEEHVVYLVVRPLENQNIKLIIDTSSHRGKIESGTKVTFASGKVTSIPVVDFGTQTTITDNKIYKYNCAFMGDSITQFWNSETYGGHPIFFSSNNFLGRGISGQRTWDMVARFKRDIIDNNPRAVIILAGTNNIGHFPDTCDLNVIRDNIATMCEMAESAGIVPIVCSILPRSLYNNLVIDANKLLKEYAASKSYAYVDYYSQMSVDDKIIKAYFPDGLHPNSAGFTKMEEICLPVIEKIIFE